MLTHLTPFRRLLYSPATLAIFIEFSCRRPDTFRFIFSARYRALPFVRRPSTSSLSFCFQSTAIPPGEWKRPSYINSVAECHDNNDLTAVRSNIFYHRCSCSRFVKIRSSDFPMLGSPYRSLRVETIRIFALFYRLNCSLSLSPDILQWPLISWRDSKSPLSGFSDTNYAIFQIDDSPTQGTRGKYRKLPRNR